MSCRFPVRFSCAFGFAIIAIFVVAGSISPTASSFNPPAAPPMPITVTIPDDTGAGSLRAAIDQANTNPGPDSINFIAGLGTINVGSTTGMPLPTITEALTIDGGASRVELNGTAAGGDGITVNAGTQTVSIQNLVINRFSSGVGISLLSDNNIVTGNFLGTNTAGTAALGNIVGIGVSGSNNTIGGTTAAARNLISGNTGSGVGVGGHNNVIQGNFIGTAANGTTGVPNSGDGVDMAPGSFSNLVGGTAAGEGNVIAFNLGVGIGAPAGINNSWSGNSIFSNVVLGIDLNDNVAPNANDPCDADGGANSVQNFPDLTSATSFGATTNVVGSLDSTASSSFHIEFFANDACDPSGNGQGKTFLGFVNVNTDAACIANFNVSLNASVLPGKVITATATNSTGSTSEFSQCVAVVSGATCKLTCSAGLAIVTSPNSNICAATVDYPPPSTSGPCGAVTCNPPAGSVFAVGTTQVMCSEGGGASCSFPITVIDRTPPHLSCPQEVSAVAAKGASSTVVTYADPKASDNCDQLDLMCSPPSGSVFPVGTTPVQCVATDAATNAVSCLFNVVVNDADAPVITCPSNVTVSAPSGQTSAVVTFPPPGVTDNLPGATASCSPASGSSFAVGTTVVTCTAVDISGNRSSCSFSVLVTAGGPTSRVTIPGGKAVVEFGSPTAVDPRRKPAKPKNNPCSLFQVDNLGLGPIVITLDSISRTGTDVDSSKISDPNDSRFFTLSIVNSDQSQTELDIGGQVTIPAQRSQSFCLRFNPLLPALASRTTGLAAGQVLPDTVNSRVTFRQNGGGLLVAPVLCHVGTGVTLIDPTNPKRAPAITFARNGNTFTVSFAVHDSNLNINRAKYEFLGDTGQVIGEAFEIDLTEPLRGLNLVRGQSVAVEQNFSGASSHSEVVGVRVTVFDGEGSTVATASQSPDVRSQLFNQPNGTRLLLPTIRMVRK